MFTFAWWESHETIRYPIRVVEYLEGWRAGWFYPRWAPDLLGGCGVPFFNFYPPLLFFACSLLSVLSGCSPLTALKLVVLGLAILGAWSTYALAWQETRRQDASWLASIAYTYLPYRSVELFERGSLAEFAAYSTLPAVILGYRRLFLAKDPSKSAVLASLAHASVILFHTLSGLVTTGFLAVWLFWRALGGGRSRAILGLTSWTLALGLSSVYLVPAYFERNQVHLKKALSFPYLSEFNTLVWFQAARPSFTPGLLFWVFSILWLAQVLAPRGRSSWRRVHPWMLLAWLTFLVLFQWAVPLWRVIPYGNELQFPWRLLGLVGLFSALGLAEGWAASVAPSSAVNRVAWLALLLGPLTLGAQRQVRPSRTPLLTPEAIRAENTSTCSVDEYLPIAVPYAPRPEALGDCWSSHPSIQVEMQGRHGLDHWLTVRAAREGDVRLAIHAFPGWRLSGVGSLGADSNGFLRIRLPLPGNYRLRLWFDTTPLRSAAALLSWVSVLSIVPLITASTRYAHRDSS